MAATDEVRDFFVIASLRRVRYFHPPPIASGAFVKNDFLLDFVEINEVASEDGYAFLLQTSPDRTLEYGIQLIRMHKISTSVPSKNPS